MGNFDHFNRGPSEYFNFDDNTYDNERNLVSVLINEYYNKFGVCLDYYITSYDTSYDKIWGEDNNRRYIRNFEVQGYLDIPKEDKIWSKFGIEGTDEVRVWISKRNFEASSIDKTNTQIYKAPQIGDIIRTDYSNYFYEITEVAEDSGNYFQSRQHVWELTIRPMKNENIESSPGVSGTPIEQITSLDDIFDIKNTVDVKKDDVLYEPESGEQPNKDPFGNW